MREPHRSPYTALVTLLCPPPSLSTLFSRQGPSPLCPLCPRPFPGAPSPPARPPSLGPRPQGQAYPPPCSLAPNRGWRPPEHHSLRFQRGGLQRGQMCHKIEPSTMPASCHRGNLGAQAWVCLVRAAPRRGAVALTVAMERSPPAVFQSRGNGGRVQEVPALQDTCPRARAWTAMARPGAEVGRGRREGCWGACGWVRLQGQGANPESGLRGGRQGRAQGTRC